MVKKYITPYLGTALVVVVVIFLIKKVATKWPNGIFAGQLY